MLFTNKNDVKIFEMDRSQGVRSALGFPMKLNAATAASITTMCDALPKIMPELEIPLIIFHDPEVGQPLHNNSAKKKRCPGIGLMEHASSHTYNVCFLN